MDDNEIVDKLFLMGANYWARLPYRSGMKYTVSLSRNGNADAPDSHVTLPDSFEILQPVSGTEYTDGDTIPIQWFPTGIGKNVTMSTKLTCILENGSQVKNTGDYKYTFKQAGYTESSIADNLSDTIMLEESKPISCSIDITVTHSQTGKLDPAFKNGYISSEYSRTVQVKYIAQ